MSKICFTILFQSFFSLLAAARASFRKMSFGLLPDNNNIKLDCFEAKFFKPLYLKRTDRLDLFDVPELRPVEDLVKVGDELVQDSKVFLSAHVRFVVQLVEVHLKEKVDFCQISFTNI